MIVWFETPQHIEQKKRRNTVEEILSPMPGTICEINVRQGDRVVEDQELMFLEAMKMENPIISPCNGVVKTVAVKTGDSVAVRQLLVVIE